MPEYTPEQIQENRKRWVAALRSGKYPQTKGLLQRTVNYSDEVPAGFCCLGVAESLFNYENARVDSNGAVYYRSTAGPMVNEDACLTLGTMDKLGLNESGPYIQLPGGKFVSLVLMNDHHKLSFAGIANAIEAQSPEWDGNPRIMDNDCVSDLDEIPLEYR